MRDATWPAAAKIRNWSLAITAHSRGDTGTGGHYAFERGPGAMWTGRLDVPPMCSEDAAEFRAFLHSLRGRSGTFGLPLPGRSITYVDDCLARPGRDVPLFDPCMSRPGGRTVHTDCTDYSDGTAYADAFDEYPGARTVHTDCTIYSDGTTYRDEHDPDTDASMTLTANVAADSSTLTVDDASLAQVGDYAMAGGQLFRIVGISGNTLSVRPRVRSAISSGGAVTYGQVTATFRLATDAPLMAFILGRSTETQIEIEEAY